MSHRTAIITVRMTSFLTMVCLVWAWHLLMATATSIENRNAPPIFIVSPVGMESKTLIGRTEGNRTRENRTLTGGSSLDIKLLQQKALHDLLGERSFPLAILTLGSLAACLLAPVHTARRLNNATDIGRIDRTAA